MFYTAVQQLIKCLQAFSFITGELGAKNKNLKMFYCYSRGVNTS